MSPTVVERAKNLITGNLISSLASRSNEAEEKVKRFADAGIPTLLAFFLNHMETSDGANIIHKLAVEATGAVDLTKRIPSVEALLTHPATINIMTVLNRLFPGSWTAASNAIASYAATAASSSTLLAVVTTGLLSMLGYQIKQENFSAPELAAWLLMEKKAIIDSIPPGYNLAGALGLSSVGSLGLGAANMSSGVSLPADSPAIHAASSSTGPNRWFFPVLVIIALLVLLGYFLNR